MLSHPSLIRRQKKMETNFTPLCRNAAQLRNYQYRNAGIGRIFLRMPNSHYSFSMELYWGVSFSCACGRKIKVGILPDELIPLKRIFANAPLKGLNCWVKAVVLTASQAKGLGHLFHYIEM